MSIVHHETKGSLKDGRGLSLTLRYRLQCVRDDACGERRATTACMTGISQVDARQSIGDSSNVMIAPKPRITPEVMTGPAVKDREDGRLSPCGHGPSR